MTQPHGHLLNVGCIQRFDRLTICGLPPCDWLCAKPDWKPSSIPITQLLAFFHTCCTLYYYARDGLNKIASCTAFKTTLSQSAMILILDISAWGEAVLKIPPQTFSFPFWFFHVFKPLRQSFPLTQNPNPQDAQSKVSTGKFAHLGTNMATWVSVTPFCEFTFKLPDWSF